MKEYTYKIVGVTYKGRDGDRQKVLRKIWNDAVKEEYLDIEIRFEDYLFGDDPATLVLFNGLDVGSIAADQVESARDLREKSELIDADLSLSGTTFDEYVDLKESWRSRKQDLKDGIIDEYDIADMEEALADLKEDPIYSAVINFYVKTPEDDLPREEPEPEPEKKGLFSKLFKK